MRGLLLLFVAGCSSSEASPPVAPPPRAAAPAAAAAAAAPDSRDPADRWSCGDEPLAPCPLQGFMNAVLAPAAKRRDFAAVEVHLVRLAGAAPIGYDGWREQALRGAAAAHRGDLQGIRAACGACHETYEGRYRREVRDRAFSDGRKL